MARCVGKQYSQNMGSCGVRAGRQTLIKTALAGVLVAFFFFQILLKAY